MADVTGPDAGVGRRGNRAQLLLVGALSLAVIFVALALLLNTAIYTENLGARDLGASSTPAIEYERTVTDVAGGFLETAGNPADNYTQQRSAFETTVDDWADAADHHRALAGQSGTVEVDSITDGTRIVDDDPSRNLTNADGAPGWTVATDVRTRNATMTVDPDLSWEPNSTVGDITDEDPYYVRVSNAENWTVFVHGVDEACVDVYRDGERQTDESACVTDEDDVTIDLVAGSVRPGGEPARNATPVEHLDVFAAAGPNHTVEYGNGDNAAGTYELVVDREMAHVDADGPYNDRADGESPYLERTLYDADLRVAHRDRTVTYATDVRIAPREPDYE